MHLLGEKEATVHLPHVAAMNLGFGVDMDTAFKTSCATSGNRESRTIDNQAISWMSGIYFSQKKQAVGVKYKHIGCINILAMCLGLTLHDCLAGKRFINSTIHIIWMPTMA